jgi:hypothetical protein
MIVLLDRLIQRLQVAVIAPSQNRGFQQANTLCARLLSHPHNGE